MPIPSIDDLSRELKKAKSENNFLSLIYHLKTKIFPAIGFCSDSPLLRGGRRLRDENTYHALGRRNLGRMLHIIETEFYARHVWCRELDLATARHYSDVIFHLCQYAPDEAGKLLNNKILWGGINNYFISNCLIQYGANVNTIHAHSMGSTLFHAITSNADVDLLRQLIEHGADYNSYRKTYHNVPYTMMLIVALRGAEDIIKLFIEKFPTELESTLHSLDQMLAQQSDTLFPCEFGVYTVSYNGQRKIFYTQAELLRAKTSLVEIAQPTVQPAHSNRFFAISSTALAIKDINDENKNIATPHR